jgi:hypothetical protein
MSMAANMFWAAGSKTPRDMERAHVRFGGFVLLPEVFWSIGVSLISKV